MNSGNMSAMKEVEETDKNGSVCCLEYLMRQNIQGTGTGSAIHVCTMKRGQF